MAQTAIDICKATSHRDGDELFFAAPRVSARRIAAENISPASSSSDSVDSNPFGDTAEQEVVENFGGDVGKNSESPNRERTADESPNRDRTSNDATPQERKEIKEQDNSRRVLSDIVVNIKYARFLPEKQRRETWSEVCQRHKAMFLKRFPALKDKLDDVYARFVVPKLILPSMRGLQFAGAPIEKNNARIFNCSFLAIDAREAFGEIMFLLMSGCGVGFSVQWHHIAKLPHVCIPEWRPSYRHRIDDSTEGWADAVRAIMDYYFDLNDYPIFIYDAIRPKGAPLSSGGKAPGHLPLRACLRALDKLLRTYVQRKQAGAEEETVDAKEDGKETGKENRVKYALDAITVHDAVCHIAVAVLSGGIRRSALLSLFTLQDKAMRTCKHGEWWRENAQRGHSNNSAALYYDQVSKEDWLALWKDIVDSHCGEPGAYWSNDPEFGCNPCCEIGLKSQEFCVSGDTLLITRRNGIQPIASLSGQEVEVWNGQEWSLVTPHLTRVDAELVRVRLNDGSFLDCTPDHRFSTNWRLFDEPGTFKERTAETMEKMTQGKQKYQSMRLERTRITPDDGVGQDIDHNVAYTYGFAAGDGWLRSSDSTNSQVEIGLFGAKRRCLLAGQFQRTNVDAMGKEFDVWKVPVSKGLLIAMRDPTGNALLQLVGTWSQRSLLFFIAGWIDADGSKTTTGGVRLYTSYYERARALQLLCCKCGVWCSVNLMQEQGSVTNKGVRSADMYYLQITDARSFPCQRVDVSGGHDCTGKGKYQVVDHVERLPGVHDVYCFNEPKRHMALFGNVLTYQCNLVEINASTIVDQRDFEERCDAASFLGTLQASFTKFTYLRPQWQETTEKEWLVGVGITGIATETVDKLDLRAGAQVVRETNAAYAKQIGIGPAARLTCVKPAGTTSTVLECSSGIHSWHSAHYWRRIQLTKQEAIYKYLREKFPEAVEDSAYDHRGDQAVARIAVKAPDDAILRTQETLPQFLERVRRFNVDWVRAGHNGGSNCNNVSATITFDEQTEAAWLGEWLWENRATYHGLSVLPRDLGTYKQTPFEEIDAATYEKAREYLREFDITQVRENEDNTSPHDQVACAGGMCELVSSSTQIFHENSERDAK